jgi:dipeptidyl aminopeptidase/acylaminoacyl peptidase
MAGGDLLECHAALGQAKTAKAAFVDGARRLRTIDELDISPDGRWAAYLETRWSDSSAAGSRDVMVLDVGRGISRVVSVVGHPRALQWAPTEPNVLSFLVFGERHTRIWQYSPDDSDSMPQPIATCDSLDGEILGFTWNPTGTALAYLAAKRAPPATDSSAVRTAARLVIFKDSSGDYTGPTSPGYSRDTVGAYVAVQTPKNGCGRVLARHLVSSRNDPTISWSSGDALLVNGSALDVSWSAALNSGLAFTIDVNSGSVRLLEPAQESRKRVVRSPSGRLIAELRLEFLPGGRLPLTRYTVQVEDPHQPRNAIALDGENDGLSYSLPPVWGGNDSTLLVARYQRATARLFSVDLKGREWTPLTPDTLSVSRYAASRDGTVLLAVLENANQPQEIFRIDADAGTLTRLTRNFEEWRSIHRGHVRDVEWASRDERFTVHGFLITPPSYDSTKGYPLIVLVHGGPGHFYTNDFARINYPRYTMPPQVLTSEGYLVLLPNPRGDASYGEGFQQAIHADWGFGPFGDIDAGVDALIARGIADSTRVGIAGASYGGYLTAFAITQTGRYKAASIDDAPVDLTSEYGQNYATHSAWLKATFDGTPWTQSSLYRAQSPITYITRVRTPVIMRYGGRSNTDDDIRQSYMLAQGFELYAGLRDSGVPVQFVLHPDQGHGIVDRELYWDWVGRNLRWFGYWVMREGTDPSANPP